MTCAILEKIILGACPNARLVFECTMNDWGVQTDKTIYLEKK